MLPEITEEITNPIIVITFASILIFLPILLNIKSTFLNLLKEYKLNNEKSALHDRTRLDFETLEALLPVTYNIITLQKIKVNHNLS